MAREKVEATPRKSVSTARRRRVNEAHGGVCYYPGCEETEGLEFEHAIPLWMGGRDDDSNTAPMCRAHHKAKTALDAKLRAKTKRIIAKAEAEKKPGSIKSAGFRKDITRGFDGKVRPRTPRPSTHRP